MTKILAFLFCVGLILGTGRLIMFGARKLLGDGGQKPKRQPIAEDTTEETSR